MSVCGRGISNINSFNNNIIEMIECLAADTRSTGGSCIGDKNCTKIHNPTSNIYCCGAGTAADCDHVIGTINKIYYL